MKKLELHHIAGYFPYGLRVIVGEKSKELSAANFRWGTIKFIDDYGDDYNTGLKNAIPILRPESDLTKPIRHNGYNNGEEFVPIIELAKISTGYSDFIPRNGCLVRNCDWSEVFSFNNGSFYHYDDWECYIVKNQTQLFDLLDQWLIDYRGLIHAGLAKSVYDLKVNPYE